MTLCNRNTEALNQMAVGPVREHEGDTAEPGTEVGTCLWPHRYTNMHMSDERQKKGDFKGGYCNTGVKK